MGITTGSLCVLTWDDILLRTQKVADRFLFHMWELLVEGVCERERYNWKTSVIICACISLVILLLSLDELQVTLFAVDVAYASIPASVLERSAQQPRIG